MAMALGLACTAWLLGAPPAHAESDRFSIVRAHAYQIYSVYYLDATARIPLDATLRGALTNGVSVVIAYDIRVVHTRGWWFDDTVATLTQRYRLRYHALSRRYLVDNLNTGISHSFSRLSEALDDIANLRRLPLLDQTLLTKGRHYQVDLKVRVDAGDYPLPLRVRAFLEGAWRPSSDWYRCPLN
ncbi:hypothetical protein Thpro_022522 [Acidihalobacter prosperus]|uniref:DUF4390 domain-containing protein n=2 Tax=Acidihalobacter prosperus TaxID=160660 RepID=A0A1A6C131_9GAMM|nr:hypothetical protein Thpro_022522 [Acidihalobacter prosperus]